MIITISGKAECGKSLAANIIKEKLEEKGYKTLIINYADLLKFIAKQYLDWDGQKDAKGRNLLQWLGTDFVRKRQPEYWVDFVVGFAELFESEFDYFIIGDCRFPNEIDLWKEYAWDIVALHIERLNYENSLSSEQRQHPSETALDNYKFDYHIKTISGVNYLALEIDKFIQYLHGGRNVHI